MNGLAFILGLALLPLVGIPFEGPLGLRDLPPPARLGVTGALGALFICLEMLLLTLLGLRTPIGLLVAPVLVLLAMSRRSKAPRGGRKLVLAAPGPLVVSVLTIAVVAYAAATARATSVDLLLFWGAKGQQFARAGLIDAAFLRDPAHFLMHTDYPPLLPCLYAWAALLAGRFAWGAALLSLPLWLTLTSLTFFGFARPVTGDRRARELTALLTALLGFVMVTTLMGSNADGLLIYFETLALSAFLFAGDRLAGQIATAIGLAGATLVKVEGTVFCVCFLIAGALTVRAPRRWRAAVVIGVPPLLLLGVWVVFCRLNGLTDVYDFGRHGHVSTTYIPAVVRAVAAEASYGVWYAPWIALAALLVGGRRSRSMRMPLLAASGFVAFMLYMYLTARGDPREWIGWSAGRLLVTPLLCCFIGFIEREKRGRPRCGTPAFSP
jgi:hypothetical protein